MRQQKFIKLFLCFLILVSLTGFSVFGQTEVLTNSEVIMMTRAGLSKELVLRKIKDSNSDFDLRTEALIELKKAGVSDEVIKLMMDKQTDPTGTQSPNYSDSADPPPFFNQSLDTSQVRIKVEPNEALRTARTVAIEKSSLHPSRQALEKELLKRQEWKDLDLSIVRYKDGADLYLEIGYVSLSWITHRYVWRLYDNKSGTVIAAGETTSWGSLAKNLARDISKKLSKTLKEADN